MGHHRLIRLTKDFESISEVKSFENLGALVDITVSAFEKYSEAVLCSGKDHDSSLKIFRKGITPKVEMKIPLP
jgi:hypothetical protein